MRVTFNDAVDGDFTTKLIYFTALKQHALREAEEALCEEYGDNLHLRLIDMDAANYVIKAWLPLITKDNHMSDRCISMSDFSNFLLLDDFELETLQGVYKSPLEYTHEGFDFAIWMGDELCGLASGRCENEYKEDYVFIGIVEGSPNRNHLLKGHIGKIIDVASSYYARARGVDKVIYGIPYSDGAVKNHKKDGMLLERRGGCEYPEQMVYTRHVADILGSVNNLKGTPNFTVEIE